VKKRESNGTQQTTARSDTQLCEETSGGRSLSETETLIPEATGEEETARKQTSKPKALKIRPGCQALTSAKQAIKYRAILTPD